MDALTFLDEQLEFENANLVEIENTSVEDRVQARLDELAAQIEEEETKKRDEELYAQNIRIKAIKRMIEALEEKTNEEVTTDEAPIAE